MSDTNQAGAPADNTPVSTDEEKHRPQDNFYTPANSRFYESNPYSDLDRSKSEIRVLEISPMQEGVPINARFVTINLGSIDQERTPFIAISYVAGNHKETEAIFVDGVQFNAFANLARALRQVEKARQKVELQYYPRLIWADQICINQSDVAERSHQVGFMRTIYESAEVVLACLGEDHNDGRCLQVMNRLSRWADSSIELEHFKVLVERQLVADFREDQFQRDWNLVKDMFRCQWWRRGWIYQEAVVARHIFLLFGDCVIDWHTMSMTWRVFRKVVRSLLTKMREKREEYVDDEIPKMIVSGLDELIADIMIDGRAQWVLAGEQNLIDTLSHAQHCQFSDIRDRIFAFTGLADPDYGIVPDYGIPASMVFSMTCKRIILYERSLDVLSCCQADFNTDPPKRDAIPSWTPDWSQPTKYPFSFIYNPVRKVPPFQASGDYSSAAAFPSKNESSASVLRVQCLFIDNVATEESLCPTNNDGNPGVGHWESIIGLRDDNQDFRYPGDQSITLSNAFVNILIRGLFEQEDEWSEIVKYTEEVGRVFRTPKHYIGITKTGADIRHTDKICILLGAKVPFILRPVEDHFILISDAYVEGLMYGEAIEMMQRGELDVSTVDIH